MTLGRTSDNKLKIKTDSPKGLRAVSCGCCGAICGWPAFSTPMEGAQRFKYLTTEISANYSFSNFDPALQSGWTQCDPAGDLGFTCMPMGASQSGESRNVFCKKTLRVFINEFNICTCEVVKATGSDSLYQWGHGGQLAYIGQAWDSLPSSFAYDREIVDAEWSTWQNEEGKLYLDEKISPATWEKSFCQDCYPVGAEQYCTSCIDTSEVTCGENLLGAGGPHDSQSSTYSEPVQSGGFRVESGTGLIRFQTYSGAGYSGLYPPIFEYKPYSYTSIVHNTLAEIWGQNQLEMRP